MDCTAVNVSNIDRLMHTSRTPRIRMRQRFDLTAKLEEDEEFDVSGLSGITCLSYFLIF